MRLKVLLLFSQFDENKSKTDDLRRNMGTGQYSSLGGVGGGGGSEDFGVITKKSTIRLCNIFKNLLAVNWQSTLHRTPLYSDGDD